MSSVSLFWKMAGSLDEDWNVWDFLFVCLLVLFWFVFCCLHVYVNFLVARKKNLPSDVTGASLLPLPRHLPTAACRSPQWRPSRSNGCVSLREFPASSLAVSELNTSCQDTSKIFQKRLRHSPSSNYCTRSTLEQKQSCEPPAQRSLPPPRQAPRRTRQTPPDRIQAEMFA